MLRTLITMGLLAGLPSALPTAEASEEPVSAPVRGVWVASVGSEALFSATAIQEAVDLCDRTGINTIYVVTWNRGVTLYPSQVMEETFGVRSDKRLGDFDPLHALIEAAHEKGIRVVAWFEFGFSCSYQQEDGGHILANKPHWAAIDRDSQLVSKNGFQWMNAFDPEVQDFILSLIREVVSTYDIDGVQGDDRLPACPSEGGYDPKTVALYRSEHSGANPPTEPLDAAWVQWRADRLSDFARRIYREVKMVDPEVCVSWAPSVYPWSLKNYLQDWPRWVREGWADEVCPQLYRDNIDAYTSVLSAVVEEQVPKEKHSLLAPGILISTADGYGLSDELIRAMVQANRNAGLQGEVFFYYQGLKQHREVFESLYRTEP